MEGKPFFLSKTFWVAVATIAAPFAPPVSVFIQTYPEAVLAAIGLVQLGIRAVTKESLRLK